MQQQLGGAEQPGDQYRGPFPSAQHHRDGRDCADRDAGRAEAW
ncbi:hypothetical protein ABZ297_15865 [Nonomuraea sp. NPDC005983]